MLHISTSALKITQESYSFPTPHLSFLGAPPTYPGRQLSPQPSGIPVLMTHVPIYIRPLELSTSAGRFPLGARGWAPSQKTGRGRPLWGEPGIALTQGLGLAGSSGSDCFLVLCYTEQRLSRQQTGNSEHTQQALS